MTTLLCHVKPKLKKLNLQIINCIWFLILHIKIICIRLKYTHLLKLYQRYIDIILCMLNWIKVIIYNCIISRGYFTLLTKYRTQFIFIGCFHFYCIQMVLWILITVAIVYYFSSLWRNSPTRARAASVLRFLDHTQRHTTVDRTSLDKWSTRRRDLYLTTHNTLKRQAPMHPPGFNPTIPSSDRP